MKKIKILSLLTTVLISGFVLTSCGIDDGPSLLSSPSTGGGTPLTSLSLTGTATLVGKHNPAFSPPVLPVNGTTILTLTNNDTESVSFTPIATGQLGTSGFLSITGGTCISLSSLAAAASCTLNIQFTVDTDSDNNSDVTPGDVFTHNLQIPYMNADLAQGTASFLITATVRCNGHCRMFVTRKVYDGDLGGVSGADAKCNDPTDANYPGNGKFMALLSDGVTRIGTVSSQVDWALTASTTYVRRPLQFSATESVFSTNANAIATSIGYGMSSDSGLLAGDEVWTGLNTDFSSNPDNCNAWASNAPSDSGAYGDSWGGGTGDSNWDGALSAFLSTATGACNTTKSLYCVER